MFRQITCIDDVGLVASAAARLQELSKGAVKTFDSDPTGDGEIASRLRGADCCLVSWRTHLERHHLEAATDLRFLAMCCSLYDEASSNVDIAAARDLGIEVAGIRDYGDEGVVEFVLGELVVLFKGLHGARQWRSQAWELGAAHLGIIGMGRTGLMVGKAAKCLGMRVSYFNRSRKPAAHEAGIDYLELPQLLASCDVLTTHLPRGTTILGPSEFEGMKADAVLVNTSLGPTFDQVACLKWLSEGKGFLIVDADGGAGLTREMLTHPSSVVGDTVAGWTAQARERLSLRVLDNLKAFLAG